MEFSKRDRQYIAGETFSNGYKFKVASKNQPNEKRIDFIREYIKNKTVLHIGFCDHQPLIKQKIENNQWLHKIIIESSNKCIGIDIDKEAIEYVQKEFEIPDIYCLDILKDVLPKEVESINFDVVILGEVLEHVDNPVYFLSKINEKLKKQATELLITVPNAFDLNNLLEIKNNIEFINTDHRYWFTPFTLAKVLFSAGFLTENFLFSQTWMPEAYWKKILIRRFPMLRETLISISVFK